MAKTKLAVYDFDKTIIRGNSSVQFIKFIMLRNPLTWFLVPYQLLIAGLFLLKLMPSKHFKQVAFKSIELYQPPTLRARIEEFWEGKEDWVQSWAKKQIEKDSADGLTLVCISASPDFLIEPMAKQLGFDYVLATEFKHKGDKILASIQGPNLKGQKKVDALQALLPEAKIIHAYSDNPSKKVDGPLLDLAEKAFVVKNNKLVKKP